MSTYAGNNVFPSAITEPVAGAPATVASVNVALEGLADRTVYLKTRADIADGSGIRNLRVPIEKDSVGTLFDFAFVRDDGSAPAFWAPQFQFWIKPGKNTAGKFYIGDNGYFTLYDTGAAAPPKVSFGCGGTRTCVFDSTLRTSGGGVDLKYIQGPAAGLDFTGTWTTRTLDTIASFITFVRAGDAVVTGLDTVIAVGGGDISGTGQYIVWRSTDGGTTFTRILVAAITLAQDFLSRVIVGKSNRLVAWANESAANLGDRLYYSDDDGATWFSRTAIGFDHITDGVYLADLDLWAFVASTTNTIYTTPDPVVGAFTAHVNPSPITAMGGFGHYLVVAVNPSSGWYQVVMSNDGFSATSSVVGRDPTQEGAPYVSISASPLGGLLLATLGAITLSEKI